MEKRKKLIILIVVIVIGVLAIVIGNKGNEYASNNINKNTFTSFVERNDGSGGYDNYDNEEGWPDSTKYVLNTEKSYCLGLDGERIENSISWDEYENAISYSSLSSMNCFVYFDLI